MTFASLYRRDIKRSPKLLSIILQLAFTKHKSFTLTTQHKIVPEDKISSFSAFSLEYFKKEEGHL